MTERDWYYRLELCQFGWEQHSSTIVDLVAPALNLGPC